MPQPGLEHLPGELTTAVANLLSPHDILRLRFVSKRLADLVAPWFRLFFSKRCVALERGSLKNLYEISRHPTLRHAVHTVELCIDHLPEKRIWPYLEDVWDPELFELMDEIDIPFETSKYHSESIIRRDDYDDDGSSHSLVSTQSFCNRYQYLFRDSEDGQARLRRYAHDIEFRYGFLKDSRAFRRRLKDQAYLHTSGLGARLLAKALKNLPRRRAIGIDDFSRPWGTEALTRGVGFLPNRLISFIMLSTNGISLAANSVSRLCLLVKALGMYDDDDDDDDEAGLLYFLRRHKTTLRNVTLYSIQLDGSWTSLIKSLRDEFTLDTLTMDADCTMEPDTDEDECEMSNRRGRTAKEGRYTAKDYGGYSALMKLWRSGGPALKSKG
ncbi:hypothetical protein LX36DRAFT_705679 [Colletotrichum falcatum]|nr:hypothetical protein LX36DRAFT_705679 [Colletotrichum falcatum]